jgi:fermentation-respiration switch protein FrsA (DUF1100 family)
MKILKRLLRLAILFVVVAYLGLMVLALKSDSMIFLPHPSSYRLPELATSGARDVRPLSFASGKASIAAVYLPNPSARYTLLFSHGNAEDIGDDLALLDDLRHDGFAVLAYDYRGYGSSDGVSSEKSVYQDVESAYEFVTGTLHVPPGQIIGFGRSLGCAAAIHLAVARPVAGLIIQSPFLSAFRVLTRVRMLPWDKFDNATQIRRVHCPVLVIHGRADNVVPWWHGERIYKLANEPKQFLWVDHAGHNDVEMVASQRYFAVLRAFSASFPVIIQAPAN